MSVGEMLILLLISLSVFKVEGQEFTETTNTTTTSSLYSEKCDLKPLETRIQRLEEKLSDFSQKIDEQTGSIIHHVGRNTRAYARCKENLDRFLSVTLGDRMKRDKFPRESGDDPNFDKKLDDLATKLQLTITALQLVDDDLKSIKENLSYVISTTKDIREKNDMDSSIREVFGSPSVVPRNCKEIKQQFPNAPSGIYQVQPQSSKPPFTVFCDMVVQHGGWLTIHNRYDGSQDFFLGWEDYKIGFGNIAGEYWLGLEKIYQLTGNQVNELLIEIVDPDKYRSVANYAYFSIGPEEEGYSLKVLGGYKGNAGDALSYQAGSKFSTKDKDQDSWHEGNCAQSHSGAWWYKACDKSNLNGRYIPGQQPEQFLYQSMYWGGVPGPQIGLLQARMLIRPSEAMRAGVLSGAVRNFDKQ